MINGKLKTYQDNNMSLSCRGELTVVDGIITDVYYKGMPRAGFIDEPWLNFYKNSKVGNTISLESINRILEYNGKNNLVSVFIAR